MQQELDRQKMLRSQRGNRITKQELDDEVTIISNLRKNEIEIADVQEDYNEVVKLQIKLENVYHSTTNQTSVDFYNPSSPRTMDEYLFEDTIGLHNQLMEKMFNEPTYTPTKEHLSRTELELEEESNMSLAELNFGEIDKQTPIKKFF